LDGCTGLAEGAPDDERTQKEMYRSTVFVLTFLYSAAGAALAQAPADLNIPTCVVPYSSDGSSDSISRPQIPVRLSYKNRSVSASALVDSGADLTTFPVSFAKTLGVDLTDAPKTETVGVGEKHNLTYRAIVNLTVILCGHEYTYSGYVGFIDDDEASLLGQLGFLDHFRVTLDRSQQKLTIGSKPVESVQSSEDADHVNQRLQHVEEELKEQTEFWIKCKVVADMAGLSNDVQRFNKYLSGLNQLRTIIDRYPLDQRAEAWEEELSVFRKLRPSDEAYLHCVTVLGAMQEYVKKNPGNRLGSAMAYERTKGACAETLGRSQ
jgi:hypothetical protein